MLKWNTVTSDLSFPRRIGLIERHSVINMRCSPDEFVEGDRLRLPFDSEAVDFVQNCAGPAISVLLLIVLEEDYAFYADGICRFMEPKALRLDGHLTNLDGVEVYFRTNIRA